MMKLLNVAMNGKGHARVLLDDTFYTSKDARAYCKVFFLLLQPQNGHKNIY
jgi:hypothetical protein